MIYLDAYGFCLLLGLGGSIGMINMYYILAVIGKKFNSMTYIVIYIFDRIVTEVSQEYYLET